jgi:ATP-dependent Clp protease ATP-binding subunit ClpC
MINFDLKKTRIYEVLKWEKLFFSLGFSGKVLLVLAVVFIGFPGFSLMFLSLGIFFLIQELFFELGLKSQKTPNSLEEAFLDYQNYNLADFLDFKCAKTFSKVLKTAKSPEIMSTHLLFFVIKDNSKLKFIFERLLLDIKEFEKGAGDYVKKLPVVKEGNSIFSEELERVMNKSLEIAANKNHLRIEIGDIFSSLAREDVFFREVLLKNGLKADDIDNLTVWLENLEKREKENKEFWSYNNLVKKGSLARAWTAGYTVYLDKYSVDLTEMIKKRDMEFVGHEQELSSLERVLATQGINNALLVGQSGTGKRSIIYHLAKRSLFGQCLKEVNYSRVVELDLPSLLARIESPEEVEVTLDRIFREVLSAGNIILIIDSIHNYLGKNLGLGVVDISGILSPYLRFSQFRMIGITTYEGLHKEIEKNSSILSLFGKVEVSEISLKDTLILLEYRALELEEKYKIYISYSALRDIISLCDRYFPSLAFPEKAVDILKETVIYVCSLRDKVNVVLPKHVAKIITQKTEIPVGEIEGKEKEMLLNLEDLIHRRIINQSEAVKEISSALRRARSQITVRQGPMGVFLFLGPTGVGKTETSKALTEIYFGSERKMIRIDMSEFQSERDIPRLMGSSFEQGLLTEPVRENPFSMVLLDEIEKANSKVLNLFLQVFDEGFITDGLGRKVDFKNTIIIATSNAGSELILKALRDNEKWEGVRQRLIDYLFEERIFRPEFINRFDGVVLFTPLTKDNLLEIAELLLQKLKKNLYEKGVEFVITKELKEKIAELGYSPIFGARNMRRVLQEKVENVLASALLRGEIEKGKKVQINEKDFSLIIN